MNIPNNLFELLENEHFRKYPSMYLRGEKALDLVKFIDAYSVCELHNKLDSGILDFFNKFYLFVDEKFVMIVSEENRGNFHWFTMIELIAQVEKIGEMPLFFNLYDEFKSLQIIK